MCGQHILNKSRKGAAEASNWSGHWALFRGDVFSVLTPGFRAFTLAGRRWSTGGERELGRRGEPFHSEMLACKFYFAPGFRGPRTLLKIKWRSVEFWLEHRDEGAWLKRRFSRGQRAVWTVSPQINRSLEERWQGAG